MFIDSARIFVKAGNGGNGLFRSEEKNMYRQAALTAEMEEEAETSSSLLMKESGHLQILDIKAITRRNRARTAGQ